MNLSEFTEVSVRPRESGLYVLLLDGVITYVGVSRDVHSRIAVHATNQRTGVVPQNCHAARFDRALYLPMPIADAFICEAALLRALRPEANTHVPSKAHIDRDEEVLARFGVAANPEPVAKRILAPFVGVPRRDKRQKVRVRRLWLAVDALLATTRPA